MSAQERIATTLAQHAVKYVDGVGVETAVCTCGGRFFDDTSAYHCPDDMTPHSAHQAAAIAALPDIAVVELPQAQPDHNGDRYFDGISYLVGSDGRLRKRVRIDGAWEWALASPPRVSACAAELLAAARAAGGES